jgi:hypothetical protein
MNQKRIFGHLCLGVAMLCSLSQPLIAAAAQETTTRLGDWRITRRVDLMTDEVRCTAYPDSSPRVAVTLDTVYVQVPWPVLAVELRYGNNKAHEMRSATTDEKDMDTILVKGADLQELTKGERLRGTFVIRRGGKRDYVQLDWDATGLPAIREALRKCA